MRTVSVVGIGAGNPEHITVQAINTLNTVDVVFLTDKGDAARELTELRRAICERYITGSSYRIVTVADPDRDRGAAAYEPAVDDWRTRRAVIYERLIAGELGEQDHGAFLAWGDPAIYDSTVHVLEEVLARGAVTFEMQVIPGISSVQALAAQHKTSLTRTGRPVHITTGRLLARFGVGRAAAALPDDALAKQRVTAHVCKPLFNSAARRAFCPGAGRFSSHRGSGRASMRWVGPRACA